MRSAPYIFRGLLFAVLLVLANPARDAAAGIKNQPPLSGSSIKRLISGATVHLHTPLGSVVPVVYREDGYLSGKGGMVSFFLGASSDRGRWWVKGSRLCQKWNVWFKGKKNCLEIRRKGAKFHWQDGKGESGMATIVSRPVVATAKHKAPKKLKPIDSPTGLGGALPVLPKKKVKRSVASAKPKHRSAMTKPWPKAVVVFAPNTRADVLPTKKPSSATVDGRRASRNAKVAVNSAPNGSGTTVPARNATSKAPTFRVVRVGRDDVLNVRGKPSPDAAIIGAIPPNSKDVRIVGPCRGYWCPVVYARQRGWVSRDYLAMDTVHDAQQPSGRRQLRFQVVRVEAGDVLNIRSEPSQEASVVGTIAPNGGGIRSAGPCVGDWCRIAHGRSRGWVNRYFIAPVTLSSSRAR